MQKRVRKNSDYICAKKPKLDSTASNEQEKNDLNTMPSQYGHSNQIDIKSDSLIRSVSSVECSEFSDVNIAEKSPIMNSNIKTFSKTESESAVEYKEVFQKLLQSEESEDLVQGPSDIITSGSPNNNVCGSSMHFQDNSEILQASALGTKLDAESLESLSNYKLLQRENDILLDFDTNSTLESTNNQGDGDSICIRGESDIFLTDGSNTKDSITIQRSMDVLPDAKANPPPPPPPNILAGNNLNLCNAPALEMTTAAGEKKKTPIDQTAKVSIGNTTISVPLLKPLNFRGIITNEGGKSVPNIVRKVINIRGKKIKAPTIVQLSPVQLSRKPNAKIVQATLVGNKIQLPNIGFKSSGSFIKSNLVQTSLPKQIFEDEMVFLENTPQCQAQPTSEYELKAIENSPVTSFTAQNNINSQPTGQSKEANGKPVAYQEMPPKSSPSYMTQLCVIDSNAPPKSFESIVNEVLPTSITVTSSGENSLPKVSASVAKPRKPIMLTKTDVGSATSVGDIIRASNTSGDTNNLSKDSQQIADTTAIGKMLEDNVMLRKQIALAVQNCNRFQLKVTKTTDDSKARRNEIAISQPKRQVTKLGPIVGQNATSESVLNTNLDNVPKVNTLKSDDSQNVLLKHLLQSSINQRSNQTCNQSLAPRKLATVRAPSLGVVSSLEAQLARPGIPPVSAVNDVKPELSKLSSKIPNEKFKKNPTDREAVKTRPEMISRETSFVSTFSSKPKTTLIPSEFDNRMQGVQLIEPDAPKPVSFQTAGTPTNSNYNSINLFKFFKQKEETKSNQRETSTLESIAKQPSQVQNKTQSPEMKTDIKLATNNNYDNVTHDITGSSSTVKTKLAKMDIEHIEMRKKFKRDYPKHKRQMLFHKEPQNHQKKKSRKLSKASEDFDEFIENKVVQMKQMFVLEVLEPLLSTFLGICSIYGYNDKIKNHVDYTYHNVFKEDFGRTNLKNFVDFYSSKPYGPCANNKETTASSFQNKFYDEEFSTITHQTCDKLYQFINTLKHQHLQSLENISLTSRSPCNEASTSQSHYHLNYPGIKVQKHFNLNVDRMSPVIPMINPNNFGVVKRKKPGHMNRRKGSHGNTEPTVIFTLSSFVAENVLDILRDLENLLNIYSPISSKLLSDENKLNVRNIKRMCMPRIKNIQKTETTNIQNFLNGTYKCCRNCHLTIICGIVGSDSNSNINQRIIKENHFCDKFCCIQYKKKGRKFVVSRKRERYYPNNKSVNRISVNENNCCNSATNYKVVSQNCFWKPSYKGPANEDVNDISSKMRIAITLNTNKDTRRCILCNQKGDSFADGSSRLLNYDVNKWVHLNCALWSNSVYETINGGLMNLELTMQQGLHQICTFCNQYGASIKCFKMRCTHMYHLPCAIKEQCVFYKNKTINCASHAHRMEKKNELSSIRVRRRVYIERDENRQVAAVMHHLELSNLLRIGNLTFINVGQLLPHQLEAFHTPNYIYPIGYKIVRLFWSMKKLNKRCRYICSIGENNGRPEFVIQIQEQFESDVELRDISPKAVWQRVLEKIVLLRKGHSLVQLFTEYFSGEDLFGLSEPSIVRILESLPGVESLTDYRFKYGRNPLLELPLALNPSGSARTEPKQKHIINWKKAHTQRTSSINLKLSLSPSSLVAGEVACPYSKQFVHSKSSQYRKMKQEWRNNVYLARSKIQGLGLYAARDLEKHTMVIEYIGQVIRTEVSELREKQYDLRNRGIYMFRLDEERVVDATLSGGLARYINHSCNPNCVTEIVDVDREYRIIIFAKRRINKGEELSYDYKFDIEDDAHKISCMCDAPNCRKWMN